MPKEAYQHTALRPQDVGHDMIRSYRNDGDLVLDPFMGSGTTARMAFKLDRNYIGFEIDPTFHALCEKVNEEDMNKGRLTL